MPISPSERLRACCGALVGLLVTGLVARSTLEPAVGLPLLIAPMGASAVLLFALPSSPLAQPWALLGGNVLSALVGVSCARWIGDPVLAAAVAVGLAIALMLLLRCLHPPGGAVALLSVVGGPAIAAQGYEFALRPVGLNSLLLLLAALAFHRLTRHGYPHVASPPPGRPQGGPEATPSERLGVTHRDLDEALRARDELLDIAPEDLRDVLDTAQRHAFARHVGELRCEDVMSREAASVQAESLLPPAWELLQRPGVVALPVLDGQRRVIGLISRDDFFREAGDWHDDVDALPARRLSRRSGADPSARVRSVAQLMSASPRTVPVGTPLAELIPLMSDGGVQLLPVVDGAGRLQGLLTQADLIAALYRACLLPAREASPGA